MTDATFDSSGGSRSACPVVHDNEFDIASEAAASGPYPWLATARKRRPIFYLPTHKVWCVTRYETIGAILRDPVTFSSREANKYQKSDSPMMKAAFPQGNSFIGTSVVNTDPPRHIHLRRFLSQAFTLKVVDAMEDKVREMTDELIDSFIADGRCDFIADFSSRLPTRVIGALIGTPPEMEKDLASWASDNFMFLEGMPRLPLDEEREIIARAQRIHSWLLDHIESCRVDPQDDLTSRIVHARDDDGNPAFTPTEIQGNVAGMVTAGIDTTKVFLPLMLRRLLGEPEVWQALQSEPDCIPSAVEECLRHVAPVRGTRRTLTKGARVDGVDLEPGDTLFLIYPSANRDADVFDEPDRLDIARQNVKRHYSFGKGTHMCLGAPLARLEARVLLEQILHRMPDIRLAPDHIDEWIPNIAVPSLKHLKLEWSAASATAGAR